jgi:citrate lyase subunit beta / citryl-CoA lyase
MPASNIRVLEKAPGIGADIAMLDLEDAHAPEEKEQARRNLIEALRGRQHGRTARRPPPPGERWLSTSGGRR